MKKKDFEANLLRNDFLDYWISKSYQEVFSLLGKPVASMVGFDQRNPHHCYTLFEHCLRTAADIEVKHGDDILLKVAAFFHDVAKPVVAKEKDGRLVFYGHAALSARMIKPVLINMGYNDAELQYILYYIEHHDDFICFTDNANKLPGKIVITKDNVAKYYAKQRNNWPDLKEKQFKNMQQRLLLLCEADAKAQSEEVYIHNALVDSKQKKLDRLYKIKTILNII